MKEHELRLYADCSICHKPIGHTRLPLFRRVTIEQFGVDLTAVRRQSAFAAMMGNTRIAEAMGTDEEMASVIAKVTLSICEACAMEATRVAVLAECRDVLTPMETNDERG